MKRLLIAGAADPVSKALAEAFPTVAIVTVDTGLNLLAAVASGSVDAMLVDHQLRDPDPIEALRLVRLRGVPLPPVIYAMPRDLGSAISHQLVSELGVHSLLLKPLDPRRVVREVARLLETSPMEQPKPGPAPAREPAAAFAAIWERFRSAILARVEVLEDTVAALLADTLDPPARQHAEREAHKLAGAAGTFGFADASRYARDIELVLEGTQPILPAAVLRMSDQVVALRADLERPPPSVVAPVTAPEGRGTVLMLSADTDLTDRVMMEAEARRLAVRSVAPGHGADIVRMEADAVLLDLTGALAPPAGLATLEAITAAAPDRPVVVLGAEETFAARLEMARRGAHAYLSHPVSPRGIVDALTDTLRLADIVGQRVLAVDDDPEVLEELDVVLSRRGLEVTTLQDPLRFWEELERVRPHLVILDEDLPHVRGVELCLAVRADERWRGLPVVFLTAPTDRAAVVQRIFAARADDYIPKPFEPAELTARVETHLHRARLEQVATEPEGWSAGSVTRRVEEHLSPYLHLARRLGHELSLALVTINGGEALRARLGAGAWHAVVRRTLVLLRTACREGDIIRRFGADDFALVLFGADAATARGGLDTAVARARQEHIPLGGESIRLMLSAGIASFPADGTRMIDLHAAARDARTRAIADGGGVHTAGGASGHALADLVDVAVVEDDPALADLLVHALGIAGRTVRWWRDGDEAAAALAGDPPTVRASVIILDVDLPGRDGFAILQGLADRGITDRSHVIMLTMRSTEREVLKAMELGAADHVAKPFSIPVLMHRVNRAMEGD